MFLFFMVGIVSIASIHIASYGWYVLQAENNLRGAIGAFITAGATFLAPVILLLYYKLILQ